MTLAPYLTAAPNIQLHFALAMISLILGPVALYMRKKNRTHKIIGYIWVICMAGVALSSFTIHSFAVIGPLSPIYGLAIFTLWSLYTAIRHVIAGRIALHRLVMRNLYWYGLILAGLANFLPGRATNHAFFPENPAHGFVVIGLGVTALVINTIRQKRRLIKSVPKSRIFPLEKPATMV
ncbi:MAG: DUF2306 domain-containing protein [Loktanella sp.]|nr:DUF2306 domain-containing protein [Loktanella sp.]MDO7608764.1 DUF2306 domain-containing protein [Loktanella sp.]MDO7624767.1 DUF2306 domain-containing protein [Loktanella sp.]MDO7665056.1 DUF2306 domain-containing protein [Loktanella sp.]MDO7684611.1 DUF2306 domain-containing protein [Loktanella sp.]